MMIVRQTLGTSSRRAYNVHTRPEQRKETMTDYLITFGALLTLIALYAVVLFVGTVAMTTGVVAACTIVDALIHPKGA